MKLYSSPTTPFGRKVMVQILEAGLSDRIEVIPVAGSPLDPGTLPLSDNPLGKIPALVSDTDGAIHDSRVICRYLDQRFQTGLYPAGAGLWPVLTLEATADGILDAALLMVYESRLRPADLHFAPWVEGQWQKIERALDAIEGQRLALLQGPLTMAHIAVGCALSYLDFRHGSRDWRHGRPGLAAWEAGFARRPAMQGTQPA